MRMAVVRVDWVESERGWGTRPDGYSLHRTLSDAHKYIEKHWASLPDSAPDVYSRPNLTSVVDTDDMWIIEKLFDKGFVRCY